MAHGIAAPALAHGLAVDLQAAARAHQVERLPVGDFRADHHAAVPGIVGDELEGVHVVVVGLAVVDELEGGRDRTHMVRDALPRPGPARVGKVVGEAHHRLAFEADAHQRRARQARGRAVDALGEDRAGAGLVDAGHDAAHGGGGERHLPARDRQTKAVHQRGLHPVGLVLGAGRDAGGQALEAPALAVRGKQEVRRCLDSHTPISSNTLDASRNASTAAGTPA